MTAKSPLGVIEASPRTAESVEPTHTAALDRPRRDEAEEAVRTLIRWAGDDPDRHPPPPVEEPGNIGHAGRDQAPLTRQPKHDAVRQIQLILGAHDCRG